MARSRTPSHRATTGAAVTPRLQRSSTATAPQLVPWTGPVEHVFFHSLVIRPDLAFGPHDRLAQGFRNYFVTVGEFKAILEQLYANDWTLVDIHSVVDGTVEVPPGRKPLVLSEDDVNYYDYERPRGVGWRLVLDARGSVRVEVRDNNGTRVSGDDIVPIVDEFVAKHPDFSARGAKGILAVTGYEGVLGERVSVANADQTAAVDRARAVAARLRSTGWSFASHSYGHDDMTKRTLAQLQRDIARWKAVAQPIVGPSDVYIYPFGATQGPGSAAVRQLRDAGFTIQCDVGPSARLVRADSVWIMSRRHIDGIGFRDQRRRLAPLFDVGLVEDIEARA